MEGFPLLEADASSTMRRGQPSRGRATNSPADANSTDSSMVASFGGGGRMSPPTASVMETAKLLTLSDHGPASRRSSGGGGGAQGVLRDDDGAWDLQKALLMSDFQPEDRNLDSLMRRLVEVKAVENTGLLIHFLDGQ